MITVTTTQTRSVSTIPFFTEAESEIGEAFRALVLSYQGFAEPIAVIKSEDDLTQTIIAKYETQADLDSFIALVNQEIPGFFVMRDAISRAYGITVQRVVTEE